MTEERLRGSRREPSTPTGPGDDRPEPPVARWSPADEPEPEWAEAIRQGRQARADRLRRVFETFADDDRDPDAVVAAGDRPTEDEGR